MAKNKRHIFIHPDRIENLDEKWAHLELNKEEAKATGYASVCCLRNTDERRWFRHTDLLFTREFVEGKMPSRIFIVFKAMKEGWIMLQPCKPEWINRTHINHVKTRPLGFFGRYPYRGELLTTPLPSQILLETGISPLIERYTFRLIEYVVKDEHVEGGKAFAYRLVPISRK